MRIEIYQFGKMVIDGISYTHDLILHNDKVQSEWWRKRSHHLSLEDIPVLKKERCDVFIVGTGKFGLMKVDDEVIELCHQNDIDLIIKDTRSAIDVFNHLLNSGKQIIAAFHLTC
ncbi:MAG: hypothetical protein JW794_01475 [Candidatus Cloacimonetes bacterium]|nr:hypothetical protein [Candidatus Cloacimonadota bacterium]